MVLKVILGIVVLVGLLLVYASVKQKTFRYERSGVIHAPPEKIFPYLSNLRRGGEWSPFEKKDPNLKRTFAGQDAQVGSTMEFEGNNEAGSGKMEILKIVPNQSVDIKLTMTKPIAAENLVEFKLTPEGDGTRFSWSMSGEQPFVSRVVGIFIDLEKMVANEFSNGIENLKQIVESQKGK